MPDDARKLLGARLAVLRGRISANQKVSHERWVNHQRAHDALAQAFAEYKVAANEWRQTLGDVRSTFLTKAEFDSEHRTLRAEIAGDQRAEGTRADTLEGRVQAVELWQRDRDTRQRSTLSTFSAGRAVLVAAGTFVGLLLGLAALAQLFIAVR